MNKAKSAILVFCCAVILMMPSIQSHAQKMMFPRKVGTNTNMLQVESMNGQPVKIKYMFNYHKEEASVSGKTIYPMKYDEILYAASTRQMILSRDVYLISIAGTQSAKQSGQTTTLNIAALPEGSALKTAIDDFFLEVIKQVGIAGKKGHGLSIIQADSAVLKAKALQVEKMALLR